MSMELGKDRSLTYVRKISFLILNKMFLDFRFKKI